MLYSKRGSVEYEIVTDDIRLCNVRTVRDPDGKTERKFCFEIQMPTRSMVLQAENEKLRDTWVRYTFIKNKYFFLYFVFISLVR